MDYSRILHKPFFVKNIDWDTTTATDTTISTIDIPSGILLNELAKIPFMASVYYRAKITAIVQTSGTPMHQGCIMVSAIPTGYLSYSVGTGLIRNTLMCCPHAFLMANEATPAHIEIPFYVQSKLAGIDLTDGTSITPNTISDTYAQLRFYVWNALTAPDAASTRLSISVHFMFDELEFYVPHVDVQWENFVPQGLMDDISKGASRAIDGIFSTGRRFTGDLIDSLRSGIKSWTGLHNPDNVLLSGRQAVQYRQNLNLVDAPNYMEKMDPYSDFTHIVSDYTFDTDIDEMSLAHLLKKPQYIGTFKVSTEFEVGKLLWSRPITPIQEVQQIGYTDLNDKPVFTNVHSNIIQTFAYLSKYWKGSLKIHIQAVMSNFHYCRLIVARDYSPDTNMKTAYPSYSSVTNLLTETLEFSAGGQVQTVELPFCSLMNQLPCSTDFEINALQHGMYYIYLYQPLVSNGSVPKDVYFNVYLTCGDDFDYFGYSVQPLLGLNSFISNPAFKSNTQRNNDEDADDFIFSFETQAAVTVEVSDQNDILNVGKTNDIDSLYDMRPIKSVRDYTRRLIKGFARLIKNQIFTDNNGTFVLPVSFMLGLKPERSTAGTDNLSYLPSHTLLSRMFLGYSGGVKFKIMINGSPISEAWYVPPSFAISKSENCWIGTRPVPPVTNTLFEAITEMYGFPSINNPAGKYDSKYRIQTVSVERPNYINSNMGGYRMKRGDDARIPMATNILEFVVPYMSPYRFVGNYSKMGVTNDDTVEYLASHDMGYVVFRVAAPILEVGTSTTLDNISIELYGATTDEGRFGYQIAAPPIALPASVIGTGTNAAYYQLNPAYNPTTQQFPYSTVESPASSPGLYSIRACYYNAT